MRSCTRLALVALVSTLLVAPAAGATAAHREASTGARSSLRPDTTGPALFYTIHVTISDKKITLSRQDLPRTYSARFDILNVGSRTHSFTLGPTLLGRVVVVSRTVKPKSHAVAFFIQNNERGVLRFYSAVPGDGSKRGMQGVFTIS
jgi:hypothetical protein